MHTVSLTNVSQHGNDILTRYNGIVHEKLHHSYYYPMTMYM